MPEDAARICATEEISTSRKFDLKINDTAKVLAWLAPKAPSAIPAPLLAGHAPLPSGSDPFLGEMRGPSPPSYADIVADNCPQMAAMRTAKQAKSGVWYASLGVLAFCQDGEEKAQEWSSAHPTYTPEETAEKLARCRKEQSGPVLCETLERLNPAGCAACQHRGKGLSPKHLGSGSIAPNASDENSDDTGDGKKSRSLREAVIDAVLAAGAIFWRDADSYAFATLPVDSTLRRYRVQSREFKLAVRRIYGAAHPVASRNGPRSGSVSEATISEAILAFEAIASGGEEKTPSVRVCRNSNGIILDLGGPDWRAVEVTKDGWAIVPQTDAPLIRPNGMRPLPVPVRDPATLAKLRHLINLPAGPDGDGQFRLIVLWLLSCLWPTGPYCVLALDGEQGSGKSTACRMLRRLVDPNASDLRAPPRTEDDLLIAAANGRVVALDNVSYIDSAMADALCRLATGGGFGKRKLFTDGDEIIVSIARPVLLNGIPSLLARGDLADRAIAITLPTIPDDARRSEAQFWQEFAALAPGALALLLDAAAMALARLPELHLEKSPRMSDCAHLAVAAAPAFGWTQEQVLDALNVNREAAIITVIESDPLAVAVQALAALGDWTGSATTLLEAVNRLVPQETLRERAWPKDATRIATRLRRIMPALRRAGVEILTERAPDRERAREIIIRRSRL
jgi:hypothetical protein